MLFVGNREPHSLKVHRNYLKRRVGLFDNVHAHLPTPKAVILHVHNQKWNTRAPQGPVSRINLLEQCAPVWYTEEHHNRAITALRALEELREVGKAGKADAAPSQKAG